MHDWPLLLFEAKAEAAGLQRNADGADGAVGSFLADRFTHGGFGVEPAGEDLEEGRAVEVRIAAELDVEFQRSGEVRNEAAPAVRGTAFEAARKKRALDDAPAVGVRERRKLARADAEVPDRLQFWIGALERTNRRSLGVDSGVDDAQTRDLDGGAWRLLLGAHVAQLPLKERRDERPRARNRVDLEATGVGGKHRVVHMQVVGAFLPREVAVPRQSLRVAGVGKTQHGKSPVRRRLERNHLERREAADRLRAEVENRLFAVMQNLSAPA